MKKKAKTSKYQFVRWAGTIIAAVLIVWLISQQGWDEIIAAISKIGWSRFLLALGVMFLSRFAVSGRWYALLRSGEVEMTLGESFRLTFAGLFANNFLPSTVGGDVVRLAGAIQAGYDSAISAASVIVDRLVGMAGMALFLPLGLQKLLPNAANLTQISFAATASGAQSGLLEKVKGFIKRVLEALKIWLRHPQGLLVALLLTLVHVACLTWANLILLEGMGENVSFWVIAGFQSLIYFVTLIPISINGWGLQELSTTYVFTTLAGVSDANSISLGLLIRTLYILASLPGALYVRAILPQVGHEGES
jgi:hypothetical protein